LRLSLIGLDLKGLDEGLPLTISPATKSSWALQASMAARLRTIGEFRYDNAKKELNFHWAEKIKQDNSLVGRNSSLMEKTGSLTEVTYLQ